MNANDFLKMLTMWSLQATYPVQAGKDGRPAYPYPLATTKAERLANVKRRQSNKRRAGRSAFENYVKRADKGRGPSRKMFVPYEVAINHNTLLVK